jgi:hypothetical protein
MRKEMRGRDQKVKRERGEKGREAAQDRSCLSWKRMKSERLLRLGTGQGGLSTPMT